MLTESKLELRKGIQLFLLFSVNMAKIYISATFKDLKEYRRATYNTLRELRHDAIGMEDYVAGSDKPLGKCLRDVAKSDLYIGIFAWRYGFIPKDGNPTEKSVTELEYRQAISLGIPCLIFLLDEDAAWPRAKMDLVTGEGEAGKSIKDFRIELQNEKMVSFFRAEDDLARLVSTAVHNWTNDGRIADISQTDFKAIFQKITEKLSKEVNLQINRYASRKYIKGLFVHRDLQDELMTFLQNEPQLSKNLKESITKSVKLNIAAFETFDEGVTNCISQLQKLKEPKRDLKKVESQALKNVSSRQLFHIIKDLTNYHLYILNILEKYNSALAEVNKLSESNLFTETPKIDELINIHNQLTEIVGQKQGKKTIFSVWADKLSEHISLLSTAEIKYRGTAAKEFKRSIDTLRNNPLPSLSSISSGINSTIKELSKASCQHTLVLDRAGGGKTSLLCQLSLDIAKKAPVILLFGKENLHTRDDMLKHLFSGIDGWIPENKKTDPMSYLDGILEANGEFLYIFIDGINECRKIDEFDGVLIEFFKWARLHRIRGVISCRDIYWDFFDAEMWEEYLHKTTKNRLYQFSLEEYRTALPLYFEHYRIRCDLLADAQVSCQHPLLLRFFCEAFSRQDGQWAALGPVHDIRLKELFDVYVENKTKQVHNILHHQNSNAVLKFLLDLASYLYSNQRASLPNDDIEAATGYSDTSTQDSLYLRLLDEDIIIEEEPTDQIDSRLVQFVYEEFMEYMIARSFLRKLQKQLYNSINELFTELADIVPHWANARGIIEYLVVMLLGSSVIDEQEDGYQLLNLIVEKSRNIDKSNIWIQIFWSILGKVPVLALQPRIFDLFYPAISLTPKDETNAITGALSSMSRYSEVGGDKLSSIFIWSTILPNVLTWSDISMLDGLDQRGQEKLINKLTNGLSMEKFSDLDIVRAGTTSSILETVLPYLNEQARNSINKHKQSRQRSVKFDVRDIMHQLRKSYPEYQIYLLNGLFHFDQEIRTYCADNIRFVIKQRKLAALICRRLADAERKNNIRKLLLASALWLERYHV